MTDYGGPTGRALLALEAIQAAPGITGDRLATRLGVSDRAARRYVGILREAGIPIESATGRYGGYRIGRGVRVPLTFSTSEALGLVMAVLQGWHGSVDADHPAATALGKIIRVLPVAAVPPVEALRRIRAHNPGDAAAIPDPDLAATVAQACEAGCSISVSYQAERGQGWQTVVDPWAVVVRHGRWYLLCRSHRADARRVLRLDRMTGVEPTGESFDPPVGLDPVREVEEHLTDGWPVEIEVRIDASFDEIARCVPRSLGRLEPITASSCRLRGSTEDPRWYAAQLANVPAPFTVISSDEVRAELRELARRLTRAAAPVRNTAQNTPLAQGEPCT
ncbi:MAG: WYL domain-containing protein [Actinomycetota bacterium]|nr:WYL domain-containing protein [Actinomycetota bacterium]MDQ2955986.1 WYL domain-containing protein [Actinomycetota bacterium]